MCYVSSYYKFWFDLINLSKRIFFEWVTIISFYFIYKISNNFILNALRNPYIYMYIMKAYQIFVINLEALFQKKKTPTGYCIIPDPFRWPWNLAPLVPDPPSLSPQVNKQTHTVHMTDTSRGRSSLTHYNEYRL